MSINKYQKIATALSNSLLAGDSIYESMLLRAQHCLGFTSNKPPEWLSTLCRQLAHNDVLKTAEGDHNYLINTICNFKPFQIAYNHHDIQPIIQYYLAEGERFKPADFLHNTQYKKNPHKLANIIDLCSFLQLEETSLHWLSDPWNSQSKTRKKAFQHYRYKAITKNRSMTATQCVRLLEVPKYQLKIVQQKLHHGILSRIPLHPDAHGFRKNHSTRSYTEQHLNKRWVLKLDLSHFFLHIAYARVWSIFTSIGYPKIIARYLTLLCTNQIPYWDLKHYTALTWQEKKRYEVPHIPQGAPTSPALSNLAAFHLDCRLHGLADSLHGNYTRYADDMVFSSNKHCELQKLIPFIAHIVSDEGFKLNFYKTRVMGQGQQQKVTGIILNQHQNCERREYERLKAIVYNCRTKGVNSQIKNHKSSIEFYAWLKGKIYYVHSLNPKKGSRLVTDFKRIQWPHT